MGIGIGKVNTDEALRSALKRLPVAVVIVDHLNMLRPMNRRGEAFFETEELQNDLLEARPSHPLSRLIRDVLELPGDQIFDRRIIRFPSGSSYSIEPSRRSEKGRGRWTILLVDAVEADPETLFAEWAFTPRERELARHLIHGLSSPEIAGEMGVTAETVKSHIAGILEKSGSRSRAEFLSRLLKLK